MRIFLSCLITAFSFSIGYAQTTAMDWTRNDCDSNISHHLFAELDSGYVVQIDFDMIPTCPTCNASVHTLKPMLDDKRNQYPNRLKYYCVGYDDSYTCSQMLNWKSAQSVDAPVFTGGATEVAYYGGMGMPTIIVLGGRSAHKLYYKRVGFTTSDTSTIAMAIDSAMAESNQTTAIEDVQNERSFKVFPNPAYDLLHIELPNSKAPESITIKDIAGKEMLTRSYSSTINIYSLSEGIYFVSIRLANGDLASKKFIKL